MLDALKNLNFLGGKEDLLFFICDIIGNSAIKIHDAEIICARTPGKHYLSIADLTSYCIAFGWIQVSEDTISVTPDIAALLGDKEKLNYLLIKSTINQLFKGNILDSGMFYYDSVQSRFAFKNELLPLSLSAIRNMLVSQGFLIPLRESKSTRFYISCTYDALIAKHCKEHHKQLSIEQLKKRLEHDEFVGEIAELFVLEYEKRRLGLPLCEKVQRISEIDVMAGYDIVSFDSPYSQEPDRFIEVKAVSSSGFYWSKNEYETSKLKGDKYYLYLIEISKINEADYLPQIIKNPAKNVIDGEEWLVEPLSYFIRSL